MPNAGTMQQRPCDRADGTRCRTTRMDKVSGTRTGQRTFRRGRARISLRVEHQRLTAHKRAPQRLAPYYRDEITGNH